MSNSISPLVSPLRPTDDSTSDSYRTDNLELSAYLLARGHRLIGADPSGSLVTFVFESRAAEDVANFFAGTTPAGAGAAPIPPIKLFEHHRTLRSMISTIRNTGATANVSPRRRRVVGVA
jgi:hypothetical protein